MLGKRAVRRVLHVPILSDPHVTWLHCAAKDSNSGHCSGQLQCARRLQLVVFTAAHGFDRDETTAEWSVVIISFYSLIVLIIIDIMILWQVSLVCQNCNTSIRNTINTYIYFFLYCTYIERCHCRHKCRYYLHLHWPCILLSPKGSFHTALYINCCVESPTPSLAPWPIAQCLGACGKIQTLRWNVDSYKQLSTVWLASHVNRLLPLVRENFQISALLRCKFEA